MKLVVFTGEGNAVPPDLEGRYKGTFVRTVFDGAYEGEPTINKTAEALGYSLVRIQTNGPEGKLNVMLVVDFSSENPFEGYTEQKANEIIARITEARQTPKT